jgi:hypothetical protein
MNEVCTWITVKDGKVSRVRQTRSAEPPGPEWRQVPNDWGGNSGDDAAWLDEAGRRVPDARLVEEGKRRDNRGLWFRKQNAGETKRVYNLDEVPGEDWTREAPLENEAYQTWDEAAGSWAVDTEAKEKAEKERRIAEKKAAITDAEARIQRSSLARQRGIATAEDEQFFTNLNAEIDSLREELRKLLEEESHAQS